MGLSMCMNFFSDPKLRLFTHFLAENIEKQTSGKKFLPYSSPLNTSSNHTQSKYFKSVHSTDEQSSFRCNISHHFFFASNIVMLFWIEREKKMKKKKLILLSICILHKYIARILYRKSSICIISFNDAVHNVRTQVVHFQVNIQCIHNFSLQKKTTETFIVRSFFWNMRNFTFVYINGNCFPTKTIHIFLIRCFPQPIIYIYFIFIFLNLSSYF